MALGRSPNFPLIVDVPAPLALSNGRTIGQLAVAWALRREEVTSAIVGARRPGQITETVRAAEKQMTPEEEDAVARCLEEFEERIKSA